MFTGIVETMGEISLITANGSNLHFTIESNIAGKLKVDQSVAHNGVCLTVTHAGSTSYQVTAVAETLSKTNLGDWKKGDKINLERSLLVGSRLDGHFVQGHVDITALCIETKTLDGSWLYRFRFPVEYAGLVIEKGSICINGVSLTVFNVGKDEFTVTIIPYTYAHTNFQTIGNGTVVNIEFDVMGKYFLRQAELMAQ